jgi:hypothetical protein
VKFWKLALVCCIVSLALSSPLILWMAKTYGGERQMQEATMTIEKTASAQLEISEAPSFEISLTPALIKTFPERTVAYNVTITPNASFAGDVELSPVALPAGLVAEFLPAAKFTVGGAPKSAQLNITTPAGGALIGKHTITVKALSTIYN